MPPTFYPRKVDRKAYKRWFDDAVHLSSRQLFRSTIIAVLFCLPYIALLDQPSPESFLIYLLYCWLCPPCVLTLLVSSSYCADLNERFLTRTMNTQLLLGFIRTGFCYLLVILAVLLISIPIYYFLQAFNTLEPTTTAGNELASSPDQAKDLLGFLVFTPGESLGISVSLYIFFGALTWFLAPLMYLADCPFKIGIRMALKALELNPFVLWLSLAATLILNLLNVISGILAIPAVVILGAMMYASFREVFWGRKKSFPVARTVSASTPAPVVSSHPPPR